MNEYVNKVYSNAGNLALLSKVPEFRGKVLDIGFGSGGNAKFIRDNFPLVELYGVTMSQEESKLAATLFDKIWVLDVEREFDLVKEYAPFDYIICSHVLEHLRNPAQLLMQCYSVLAKNGIVLIAVPNISYLNQRMLQLMGRFNYEQTGIMDRTHLRFFNYYSVKDGLELNVTKYEIVNHTVDAVAPFGRLLSLFGNNFKVLLNKLFGKMAPNIFGWQIILILRHK